MVVVVEVQVQPIILHTVHKKVTVEVEVEVEVEVIVVVVVVVAVPNCVEEALLEVEVQSIEEHNEVHHQGYIVIEDHIEAKAVVAVDHHRQYQQPHLCQITDLVIVVVVLVIIMRLEEQILAFGLDWRQKIDIWDWEVKMPWMNLIVLDETKVKHLIDVSLINQ